MRGDMQVRFGGRYGKTYCRKAVRRSVPSLRAGKGGNIIALAKVIKEDELEAEGDGEKDEKASQEDDGQEQMKL